MNKEEYYKRIEDKMDRQTSMLIKIEVDVNKEFNVLKLAHQKLKYGVIGLTILIFFMISTDYPKIANILKKFM